jgi:hypothetical protein
MPDTTTATIELPTIAQLVRVKRRVDTAMEQIGSASYALLQAMRVFNGEAIPSAEPFAVAYLDIQRAEAILDAATALLAMAQDDATKQLAKAREAGR